MRTRDTRLARCAVQAAQVDKRFLRARRHANLLVAVRAVAELDRRLRQSKRHSGTDSNSVDDDAGISRDNLDSFRTYRNRHFDADEVVLNGAVAHSVMFADVGVALRNCDIFRRTIIERHLDTELKSRPKREVRQELEDKGTGNG